MEFELEPVKESKAKPKIEFELEPVEPEAVQPAQTIGLTPIAGVQDILPHEQRVQAEEPNVPWQERLKQFALSFPKALIGAGETAGNLATGMIAYPVSGLAMLVKLMEINRQRLIESKGKEGVRPEDLDEVIRAGEKAAQWLTYQPQTEYGKIYTQATSKLMALPSKAIRKIGEKLVDQGVDPGIVTAITTPLEFATYGALFKKAGGLLPKDILPKTEGPSLKELPLAEHIRQNIEEIKAGPERPLATLREKELGLKRRVYYAPKRNISKVVEQKPSEVTPSPMSAFELERVPEVPKERPEPELTRLIKQSKKYQEVKEKHERIRQGLEEPIRAEEPKVEQPKETIQIIYSKSGKPYKRKASIVKRLKDLGVEETHEPVKTDEGWVGRPKEIISPRVETVPGTIKKEAVSAKSKISLQDKIQIVKDQIATRKANKQKVPQYLYDRLNEWTALLEGRKKPGKNVVSLEVFGHPSATNIRPEKYGNLIPIKVRDKATVEKRINKTQKLIDELQAKLGKNKKLSVEEETVLGLLKNETMPELNRLWKQLEKVPEQTSKVEPQKPTPKQTEVKQPWEMTKGEFEAEYWKARKRLFPVRDVPAKRAILDKLFHESSHYRNKIEWTLEEIQQAKLDLKKGRQTKAKKAAIDLLEKIAPSPENMRKEFIFRALKENKLTPEQYNKLHAKDYGEYGSEEFKRNFPDIKVEAKQPSEIIGDVSKNEIERKFEKVLTLEDLNYDPRAFNKFIQDLYNKLFGTSDLIIIEDMLHSRRFTFNNKQQLEEIKQHPKNIFTSNIASNKSLEELDRAVKKGLVRIYLRPTSEIIRGIEGEREILAPVPNPKYYKPRIDIIAKSLKKKPEEIEKEINEITKRKQSKGKRQAITSEQTKLYSGLPITEVTDKAITALNLLKKAKDEVMKTIDVEYPWRQAGAPELGFALKNVFSKREAVLERGLEEAKKIAKSINYDKELAPEVVLSAEDPKYFKQLPKNVQEKIKPAVEHLNKLFEEAKQEYARRGVHINFKERILSELDDLITQALEAGQEGPEIEALQEARQIAERMNFVHIPTALWFRTFAERKPVEIRKILKLLATQKRKTLRIKDLIDRGLIKKEDVHPVDIVANYYRRMGRDFSLLDIVDAAVKEGFASKKPKANYVKIDPRRAPILRKYYVHPMLADYIHEITKPLDYSTWDKIMSATKMMQFYNPLFLPMYDVVQQTMLMGPKAYKMPKYWREAIKDVAKKTDDYWEALDNGLASKPYDLPWDDFLHMIDQAKKQNPEMMIDFAKEMLSKEALKNTYRLSWNTAWQLDKTIRMASYRFLRDEGYSPREAAQIAAKFHSDYASVPIQLRRKLNKLWFTPTFKLTMGKLFARMIADGLKSITKLKGGNLSPYAKGLLYTFAILEAYDLFMTKYLGFERDEWGRRYIKRDVDTEQGKKDLVVTWSTPANMWLKYIYRGIDAARSPELVGGMKEFLERNKWEFGPIYRALYDIIWTNKTPSGDYIVNPFEDTDPIKKLTKRLWYFTKSTVAILQLLDKDQMDQTAKKEFIKETSKGFEIITRPFIFKYMRSSERDRIIQAMKKLQKQYITMVYHRLYKGKPLKPEHEQAFQKMLKDLEEKLRKIDEKAAKRKKTKEKRAITPSIFQAYQPAT